MKLWIGADERDSLLPILFYFYVSLLRRVFVFAVVFCNFECMLEYLNPIYTGIIRVQDFVCDLM